MAPTPSHARIAPTSDGPPDPRVNAWRADLADIALEGRVPSARFARPAPHIVVASSVEMRIAPGASAVAVSELLLGEAFAVIETAEGWAWGYAERDHYVGYLPADALVEGSAAAEWRVAAPWALGFAEPDIKSPVTRMLPMNALVDAGEHDQRFMRTAAGDFVHRRHLAEAGAFAADPVAIASAFIGTPYKWGGRTRAGIDCSGLVQVSLQACGHWCPRDSDMQKTALGHAVDGLPLERGDLVFFPGHVGMMMDAANLLHANAFHMATVVEPLGDVIDRLLPQHREPVTAVRRLG